MSLSQQDITNLYIRLRPELERTISRRVRDGAQAADLAHDLYFRLHHLAARFPNVSEARLYLLRMAANLSKDHLKIQGNRARLLEGLAVLYDFPPESPEALLIQRQMLSAAAAALTKLTDRQRDMVRRSRILAEDYETIANAWGVSKSTVQQEILRGLKLAREAARWDDGRRPTATWP